MSLQAGHKLAHYEILEPIGKGGMGEVYRARDGKLGRDVAIKVLPDEFAENEERLSRFQREAKVLASLNHPNIAAIYGLEQSESTHYLVLELVPGETLAERIARGPIPLDEVLEIATKIAEALEEAHEQGVVHRDLKPANVKQTEDGKIKVLDFGLAKVFQQETSDADNSISPTLTRGATRIGVILGTAPYMSPEQARGKPVDRRSDVFAFGCVLYEMLTGKKAFDGETASDILASVIKTEPDWSSVPSSTPPALVKLLHRCLAKDAKRRLRDFGDAGLELRDLLSEPVSSTTAGAPAKAKFWALVLAGLVVFVLAWIVARRTDIDPPRNVKRFSIPIPSDLELPPSQGTLVALSPDGTELLFSAEREGEAHVFRRSMDRADFAAVSGTERGSNPAFSPDGKFFVFRRDDELVVASIDGGVPANVTPARSDNPHWANDGYIYFALAPFRDLYRVPATGGEPELLLEVEAGDAGDLRRARKLPRREVALFTDWRGSPEASNVMLLFLDTGERRILIEGGNFPQYVPTGHLVFVRDEAIHAVAFDLETLQIVGTPRPVIEDVRIEGGGAAQFAISDEGTLVYIRSTFYGSSQLMLVDRNGHGSLLSQRMGVFSSPRLSPDGSRVALTVHAREGTHVWVLHLERDILTRATFEGFNRQAIWSPHGEELAVSTAGPPTIFITSPESGRDRRVVLELEQEATLGSWLPDGSGLVIASDRDILQLAIDEQGELRPLVATSDYETHPSLSPNGQFLAYASDESGDWEVYVARFPELSSRLQISTEGGLGPRWSHDGSELFYRNEDKMLAVRVSPTGDLDPGRPELLFQGTFAVGTPRSSNYDVTPDGKFIMLAASATQHAPRIEVVLNWFEELKRLVPIED